MKNVYDYFVVYSKYETGYSDQIVICFGHGWYRLYVTDDHLRTVAFTLSGIGLN